MSVRVSKDIQDAVLALAGGAVIAIPTDTVYGLAARLDRPDSLAAVFALKRRPAGLALPVLVSSPGDLPSIVIDWPSSAQHWAQRYWPGALTIVVPGRPPLASQLGGDGQTIGVRQPDHPVTNSLLRRTGPLAVTSANPHGEPPCTTVNEVRAVFSTDHTAPDGRPAGGPAPPGPESLALVLDGGRCDGLPSTVVDCSTEPPACRREGALAWSDLVAAL